MALAEPGSPSTVPDRRGPQGARRLDPDGFDPPQTDMWLNTPSGRVYLVLEGQVLPHDPALRITRLTTGRAGCRERSCPGFRKAVRTWMCGRPELVDHLQRLLGPP